MYLANGIFIMANTVKSTKMPVLKALHIISLTKHLETIKVFYMVDVDFKTFWDDHRVSKINSEKVKWKLSGDMGRELEYQQLANGLKRKSVINK
jgi:hypothetical protein